MIFNSIRIQNFLSIQDITLSLANQGLVLLNGENLDNNALNNNGAGKSSILEAIVFALYGRTLRGLKGNSVVHRLVDKDMRVVLDIADDDGTIYRIIRHRKHSTNGNKSLLYRRGVDITPKSEDDFEAYVSNLLQADYSTFTASLLYSAESFKFSTATDSDIKKTFDTMLGLEVLSKTLELTRALLKETTRSLATARYTVDDCKEQLKKLDEKIQQTTENHQKFESDKSFKAEQFRQSIVVLQEKHQILAEEQWDLNKQLESAEEDWGKAKEQVKAKNEELQQVDELRDELRKVQQERDELVLKKSVCNKTIKAHDTEIERLQKSINTIQFKIAKLEQKKQDLMEQIGQPCPTCGTPLTPEKIEPARQEYDEAIGELQRDIDDTQSSIQKLKDEVHSQYQQIDKLDQEIQELVDTEKEFQTLLDRCKSLEDDRDKAIKRQTNLCEKVLQLRAQLQVKKAEIEHNLTLLQQTQVSLEDSLGAENPYSKILLGLEVDKQEEHHKINETNPVIADLEQKEKCLKFWEVAYSNKGIKSLILDDITPFLNRRVNRYLTKLAAGQIEAIFSTHTALKSGGESEKFSLTIVNRNGGGQYSANSGGEKKRIDLAINLALQDLVASRSSKKINIAIFDEVFDALDENGIDSVVSLLQELSTEKSTILVVTHNEHLKSYFDNCITIVKKDGFSYIEDNNDE